MTILCKKTEGKGCQQFSLVIGGGQYLHSTAIARGPQRTGT